MKINSKSLFGLVLAIGAGVAAFLSEVESQRKDKKIEDMENRITCLENKESE